MRSALTAALTLTAATFAAPLSAREAELHTFHCLHGCPLGAPATNDVVVREIYTLSSNDLTKLADWVAYRVTADSIGSSEGREWEADPWLSPDETLAPKAYDGASETLHIDRGHQAPLASFSGTPHASDTNVLSNITPQSSALNQGAWVRIETRERELAVSSGQAVYVLTGPLYERFMRPLPNGGDEQRVPSGYWKVVATSDGRASAFLFDQADLRGRDLCQARVTVAHVQLRSRLFLFPAATAPMQPLDEALGCTTPRPPDPVPGEIPEEPKPTKKPKKPGKPGGPG